MERIDRLTTDDRFARWMKEGGEVAERNGLKALAENLDAVGARCEAES